METGVATCSECGPILLDTGRPPILSMHTNIDLPTESDEEYRRLMLDGIEQTVVMSRSFHGIDPFGRGIDGYSAYRFRLGGGGTELGVRKNKARSGRWVITREVINKHTERIDVFDMEAK